MTNPEGWPGSAPWWWREVTTFPALDDAPEVLSAVRLGWSMAETRGRNWPGGPPGDEARMPDQEDYPLPLRIERSPTQLRIEAQAIVATLAKRLKVDDPGTGMSFGATLNGQAELLYQARAPEASQALQAALDLLQRPAAGQEKAAVQILEAGRTAQQAVIDKQRTAVAAAQQALTSAQQQVTQLSGHSADAGASADQAVAAAEAALQLGNAASAAAGSGLAAIAAVIGTLQQTASTDADTAAQTAVAAIVAGQQQIASAARTAWADLADLIWRFDAHVQDGLTAADEAQAIGYQLGRGLAETYWALDPSVSSGSTCWGFLLGAERCGELSRLVGRLASYMNEYTAPAIASSLQVWKEVAAKPAWLGDVIAADRALYRQTRRWFELVILGQDPTTLIEPGAMLRDYRAVLRVCRSFLPQLGALIVGLGFLVALLVFFGVGGSTLEKTFSGIIAAVGLSIAGLTATIKNSAGAVLTRLRQDAYTDLIAVAVQTAPPPPHKSDLRKAIAQRKLTPATPN